MSVGSLDNFPFRNLDRMMVDQMLDEKARCAHEQDYQRAQEMQGLGQQGRYPPLSGDDTHYNRWAQQQQRLANNAQQGRYPPLGADPTAGLNSHHAADYWAQHMRAGPPNPQPPHNSPTPQAVALAAALEAAAVALLNAVALLRKPS